jgi:hypothetical protein
MRQNLMTDRRTGVVLCPLRIYTSESFVVHALSDVDSVICHIASKKAGVNVKARQEDQISLQGFQVKLRSLNDTKIRSIHLCNASIR